MTDAPVLDLFRCEKQQATMMRTGCAKMWRKANQQPDYKAQPYESIWHCRACSIGAANAGEQGVIAGFSELLEDVRRYCPRCRRLAPRLINGKLCISDYNRDREATLGRNAKGNRPAICGVLHDVELLVSENGEPRVVRCERVVDLAEALIRVAREAKGPLRFSRPPPGDLAAIAAANTARMPDQPNHDNTDNKVATPIFPPGYFIPHGEAARAAAMSEGAFTRRLWAGADPPPFLVINGIRKVPRESFLQWLTARAPAEAAQGEETAA